MRRGVYFCSGAGSQTQRKLLRSVVVQDHAGSVATSDSNCPLRNSSIKRERQSIEAVPLTGPLCRQPTSKVFQARLGSVNGDAVTKTVRIDACRGAQSVRNAVRQGSCVDGDYQATAISRNEFAGRQNLAQRYWTKVRPAAEGVGILASRNSLFGLLTET